MAKKKQTEPRRSTRLSAAAMPKADSSGHLPKGRRAEPHNLSGNSNIGAISLDSSVEETPWHILKGYANREATGAGFDVERILLGCSLDERVAESVQDAIKACKELPGKHDNLLKIVAADLAYRLSLRFTGDIHVPDGCREVASSLLYLYPKLWKILDRPFTLEELGGLDINRLLTGRRRRRLG